MKKRVITLICSALLLLFPMACANAKLDTTLGNGTNELVIFYLPGTADETLIRTAQYVAKGIYESNKGRTVNLYRTDSNPREGFEPEKNISKGADNGSNEFKVLRQKKYSEEFAVSAKEYWVVVPQEASAAFVNNSKMADHFQNMLTPEGSALHIVMIGDNAVVPAEGTPLYQLSLEKPVDWILIHSDFLTDRQELELAQGETIHTGDYLLASLFGGQPPLDLEVASEENSWTFMPAEDGKTLLVLIRWPGNPTAATVTDSAGNRSSDEKTYTISMNRNAGYSLIKIGGLKSDETYTVAAPGAESVKVYRYPELESVGPHLELPELAVRGDNTLQLTMENGLGRNDFIVRLHIYKNEDQVSREETADYDPDKDAWILNINMDDSYRYISIIPRVLLYMKDGNRVLDWQGEMQQCILQISGVTPLPNAKNNITLYYDSNHPEQSVTKTYQWEEFFAFNIGDFKDLDKSVTVDPTLADAGISARITDDNRIEITLKKFGEKPAEEERSSGVETAEEESELISSGDKQITATGEQIPAEAGEMPMENGESSAKTVNEPVAETGKEAKEESGKNKILLKLKDKTYPLEIIIKDANELPAQVDLSIEKSTVSVGTEQTVVAKIGAETIAEWMEAREQLGNSFPDPEQLTLLFTDNEGDSERLVQQDDESLLARRTIDIKIDETPGYRSLKAEVKAGDYTICQEDLVYVVTNNPPTLNETAPDAEQKIKMTGFPWHYNQVDNLLMELLKTDNPITLFTDEETSEQDDYMVSVDIVLDNVKGLSLPEDAEKQEDNSWIIRLTNKEDQVLINATEPTERNKPRILTITASDGVNQSEPVVIRFEIYSEFMRYTSYVVLGLAVLLLILVIILIINQVRKPSFDRISIRCFAGADDNPDLAKELLAKSNPVSMMNFRKKPVTLTTALILTRQPPMDPEMTKVTDDITLLPTKHDELYIHFGKDALEVLGRHEKKELLSQGNTQRMRIGNTYIHLENVQR